MGKNVGKIFEPEIRKLLEEDCVLVVREYDLLGKRFTKKKLCDFIAVDAQGFFIAVEAKATRSLSFSLNKIKPHQREILDKVANTENGRAYLALNFRTSRVGQAYLIPWDVWRDFESLWHRKSIRAEEAAQHFDSFALKRIAGGWEVNRRQKLL